jgi:hypothetical protein
MKKIKKFKVTIRERQVLSNLKCNESINSSDPEFKILLNKEIQEVYGYLYPAAIYDTFSLKDIETITDDSQDIKKLIENSICVSLIAVTIGEELDKKIAEFMQNNEIAKSAIWDSIGSEAVEQSANFINRLLNEEAGLEGCTLTPRFSPGYGDLNILKNNNVLDILEASKINISVNEYGLLTPNKSITALIGWEKSKKRKK